MIDDGDTGRFGETVLPNLPVRRQSPRCYFSNSNLLKIKSGPEESGTDSIAYGAVVVEGGKRHMCSFFPQRLHCEGRSAVLIQHCCADHTGIVAHFGGDDSCMLREETFFGHILTQGGKEKFTSAAYTAADGDDLRVEKVNH